MEPNSNSDPGQQDGHDNTRRQFLAGSAGVVGGLAVGGLFSGSVLAQEDADDGEGEMEFEDDVAILNYALTLEYLEASFYKQGLDTIGEEDLCNCKMLAEDSPLRDRAYDELRTIQAQEEEHVETLRTVITDLGGEPIDEPEFDFGVRVEYPMAFLGTAVQLEGIGVSAYAGAAPSIENDDLIPPALSIHSVEARHVAFLRTLTDQTPYPDAFDEPRTKSEVLDLVGPFVMAETDGEEPETQLEDQMETPTGNETESPTGNGTETPTGNQTEAPTGNGTETPTGNQTEMPTGNQTEMPTGNGTGPSTQ